MPKISLFTLFFILFLIPPAAVSPGTLAAGLTETNTGTATNTNPALIDDKTPRPDRHFLWEATGSNCTVYLLGSVHIAAPSLYPLAPVIENAFDRSEGLCVEVNLSGLLQNLSLVPLVMKYGFYRGKDTIFTKLPKSTLDKLLGRLRERGMSVRNFARMRPWLIAMTVSAGDMQKGGYDGRYGIDIHFMNKAKGGKRIIELESAELQIRLFADMPEEMQLDYLESTLAGKDDSVNVGELLVKIWKNGDAALMDRVVNSGSGTNETLRRMMYRLVDERNFRMADRIDAWLKDGKNYFVVVGAGHLVGTNGVVSLLEKRGWPVKQR